MTNIEDGQGRTRAASTRDTPPYIQGLGGCMTAAIGDHGLEPAALQRYVDRLAPKLQSLKKDYADRTLPILRISEETSDIDAAEASMARLSEGASTIIFFGTGGSSLGGQTLAQLSGWNIPGAADDAQRLRARTRFYDNLDAATLAGAFTGIDLPTTRFVVTSKSGGTVETLTQAVVALDEVKKAGLGAAIPKMFLGLTEPDVPGRSNGLRNLFSAHGIPMLDHHTGIGGRFSVLTNVGLLPAIARGLDVRAVRAGAASVVETMLAAGHPRELSPALGAASVVALAETRNVGVEVMLSYCDRLGRFGAWFVQLWAESLGKTGKGTTPVACLGPLDQHSQLQLFMDGPRDHLVTVLRTPNLGAGPSVDAELARAAGIGFLAGRAIGDLVSAQSHAVPEALLRAGRPVRTFDIPKLDERAMGALFMHFMLETVFAADLFGVDPYDQPAVELAKTLTRATLSKS